MKVAEARREGTGLSDTGGGARGSAQYHIDHGHKAVCDCRHIEMNFAGLLRFGSARWEFLDVAVKRSGNTGSFDFAQDDKY